MHDPRVGRFFAIDPLTAKYPHYTPYSFSGNKVINCIELEGLEEVSIVGVIGKDTDPIPEKIDADGIFVDLYSRMVKSNLLPILPSPNVLNDNNISSVAVYEGMGLIKVKQEINRKGSLASTYGDAVSILYHEFQHYVSDSKKSFPLKRESDGAIVQWETGEDFTYTISDAELKRQEMERQIFVDEILPNATPEEKSQEIKKLNNFDPIQKEMTVPFRYAPSNLALDELNAYKMQLKGEKVGLYTLSDDYRHDINERISTFEQIYKRRVQYENENGLNPDGSNK